MDDVIELNKCLSRIKYGWHDKDNNTYEKLDKSEFQKKYKMPSLNQIKKNDHAICWELCELERDYFKKTKYPFQTIFVVLNMGKNKAGHSFLVFKNENNKYVWFESSWSDMKGLREYESPVQLFNDIKDNFYKFIKTKDYDKNKIEFYAYKKPLKRLNCKEFYFNALYLGKKLDNDFKL